MILKMLITLHHVWNDVFAFLFQHTIVFNYRVYLLNEIYTEFIKEKFRKLLASLIVPANSSEKGKKVCFKIKLQAYETR